MRCFQVLLLALVASSALAAVENVTPIQKVVHLLEKLQAQTQEEGKAEAAAYDKFACFCKENADEKLYLIEKATKKEAALAADIEDHKAQITALDDAVAELNKQISKLEDEQEKTQKERDTARDSYETEAADLAGAIDAIKGAIESLKSSKGQMEDAKLNLGQLRSVVSVAQAMNVELAPKEQQVVTSLLQAAPGKPHAYEYHSNDIIAVLEGLKKTFTQKKYQLDSEETADRQDFEMKYGARKNQIKAATDDKNIKMKLSAELSDAKAKLEHELAETEADHKSDQSFLDDLTNQCEEKAKQWDQRSKSRAGELTAISEALEILQGKVAGNYAANKKLVGLITKKAVVKTAEPALEEAEDAEDADEEAKDSETIETAGESNKSVDDSSADSADSDDSDSSEDNEDSEDREDSEGSDEDSEDSEDSFVQVASGTVHNVLEFLRTKQTLLKSSSLASLLLRIKADPFVKVRGLINDLVKRLEAEAEAEAELKGWCDEQVGKATSARDESQANIESLKAEITTLKAHVERLALDITTLEKEIAELNKGLNEATELRNKEKSENELTLRDATEGAVAVKQALQVLEDYYKGSAFVQFTPENAAADGKNVDDVKPETFEGDYKGNQDASKGILGLLEVIAADFDRTVETVTKEEAEAEEAYGKFKDETEASIDEKSKTKKEKTDDKTIAESDLEDREDDLKTENKILDGVKAEIAKLTPVCIDTGASWKEKTERREQEIEALKEALRILEETDFKFLQKK